ncbi:MAG: zinc-binding dehydrogenase [Pseudomonadota bacterium]
MRACTYSRHGSTDELTVDDTLDTPEPRSGEVQIRVRAAALNGFDPMMLDGSTGLQVPMPMIPCGDFAGEISALGEGADSNWSVGQRVMVNPVLPEQGMMGEVIRGAAAEFVTVPQAAVIELPDAVSFEDAAALPVAYGTALRMMKTRGAVRAGEKVLILGATGGVGVACIQLAKMAGAEVTACGGGKEKTGKLKDIGADHVIDTREQDIFRAAREIAGKPAYDGSTNDGYDVVVNYIGGDTWSMTLKLMKRHGRMLVCGATAGYDPQTDLRYIWSFEQNIIGCNGWEVEDLSELLRLVASGTLKPMINKVYELSDIKSAFDDLIERRVFGKQVISI